MIRFAARTLVLSLVTLSLLLIASAVRAQDPRVYGALEVVDSTGLVVGEAREGIYWSGSPTVFLDLLQDGRFWWVGVGRSGFLQSYDVFFDGAGCTGEAFLPNYAFFHFPDDADSLLLPAIFSAGEDVFYVPDLSAVELDLPWLSFRDLEGTCFESSGSGNVYPILKTVDVSGIFTPPFSLRRVAP